MNQTHVLGIFDEPHKAAAAAIALRGDRLEVTAYGPTPDHAIDAAYGGGRSPVRRFTLVGGILGCATGFGFPIYTVLKWPLIIGGKPLISIPPFVVIAFELTILFAALSTVAGFFLLGGLPQLKSNTPYDPRFSLDRWGVLVTCGDERVEQVRGRMKAAGAEEVQRANA